MICVELDAAKPGSYSLSEWQSAVLVGQLQARKRCPNESRTFRQQVTPETKITAKELRTETINLHVHVCTYMYVVSQPRVVIIIVENSSSRATHVVMT